MNSKHGTAAMIDPADKQTASIPLEKQKRGRGRPSTGTAMTPAEKQKAYRERQKKETEADVDGQIKLLRHLLEQTREDNKSLAGKVLELRKDNDDLKKVLDEAGEEKKYWINRALESDKKKRHKDEKPVDLEGIPDVGVWTVEYMAKSMGSRSWRSCNEPMVSYLGVPDKFELVKMHVDDMQKSGVVGNAWRAVRDDGLIYEAKVPESKRKRPVKS